MSRVVISVDGVIYGLLLWGQICCTRWDNPINLLMKDIYIIHYIYLYSCLVARSVEGLVYTCIIRSCQDALMVKSLHSKIGSFLHWDPISRTTCRGGLAHIEWGSPEIWTACGHNPDKDGAQPSPVKLLLMTSQRSPIVLLQNKSF